MKRVLVTVKNNYQIIMAALTIAAVASCFAAGQIQKAQAQKVAIEKTR